MAEQLLTEGVRLKRTEEYLLLTVEGGTEVPQLPY